MSEAIPSIMAQSWPWRSQIADEKHENQKSTAVFDIWIFFEISFLGRGLHFSMEGICVGGAPHVGRICFDGGSKKSMD